MPVVMNQLVNGKRRRQQNQIVEQMRRRIQELESTKQRLETDLEKYDSRSVYRSKKALLPAPTCFLSQPVVTGFVLSNFVVSESDDQQKIYTAYCSDKTYEFNISVARKEDEITKVISSLAENSALLEVQNTLCTLAQESCPQLVLNTIQQFIHLHQFRQKIIQKLTQSYRKYLQVFQAVCQQGECKQLCTIELGRNKKQPDSAAALEITWTMTWDKSYQTLVHLFSLRTVPKKHTRLIEQLLGQTFSNRNETDLEKWWEEFCNEIVIQQF